MQGGGGHQRAYTGELEPPRAHPPPRAQLGQRARPARFIRHSPAGAHRIAGTGPAGQTGGNPEFEEHSKIFQLYAGKWEWGASKCSAG